jgi:hypothetical protein
MRRSRAIRQRTRETNHLIPLLVQWSQIEGAGEQRVDVLAIRLVGTQLIEFLVLQIFQSRPE